jgi:hypothetical protein
MTLQLLHSEFPYIRGNWIFFFISVFILSLEDTRPVALNGFPFGVSHISSPY